MLLCKISFQAELPKIDNHKRMNVKNIGLTIPSNWSFEIRWISPEIRRISPVKSGGFQV